MPHNYKWKEGSLEDIKLKERAWTMIHDRRVPHETARLIQDLLRAYSYLQTAIELGWKGEE